MMLVVPTIKQQAGAKARYAKQLGQLTPKPCAICRAFPVDAPSLGGRDRLHMHHLDYDRPLYIAWLCDDCHRDWHACAYPPDLSVEAEQSELEAALWVRSRPTPDPLLDDIGECSTRDVTALARGLVRDIRRSTPRSHRPAISPTMVLDHALAAELVAAKRASRAPAASSS